MKTTTSSVSTISEANIADNRVQTAIKLASDKKASHIVILDLREIATFTDYFIICNGRSSRQVQAITDEIVEKLKEMGIATTHIEGYQNAEWVLLDYGDFIIHIFNEEARQFYDLERLWRDANKIEIREE